MTRVDFAPAASVREAVALLKAPETRALPLAGGTDLLVLMRRGGAWFDRLVDVSGIPELRGITESADAVRVGAAVTFAEAAASPALRAVAPLLVEACLSVGSPQIRNAGTLGGNIANAAACADSLPALAALDATATIAGPEGERIVPVASITLAPHRTTLARGELIVAFTFPKPPPGAQSAFVKLGRRNAQAIARLSMAAIGRVDAGGCIDFIRLAPGAALPVAARLTEVEDALLGAAPCPTLVAAAGAQAAEAMIAVTGRRWSTEYKEVAIQGLVGQALDRVFGLAT
jgi:CO/xanthine dehydrogenase FAD-binding subunit